MFCGLHFSFRIPNTPRLLSYPWEKHGFSRCKQTTCTFPMVIGKTTWSGNWRHLRINCKSGDDRNSRSFGIKWRPLKIRFRAVMDVISAFFTGILVPWSLIPMTHCIIVLYVGYVRRLLANWNSYTPFEIMFRRLKKIHILIYYIRASYTSPSFSFIAFGSAPLANIEK